MDRDVVVERIVRMLFSAALGGMLGAAFWLRATWFGTAVPGGFHDALAVGARPIWFAVAVGAAGGGALVVVLDLLGLELPLLPSRAVRDEWDFTSTERIVEAARRAKAKPPSSGAGAAVK